MKEQVLSIDQMQHLQELGLDTSDASMVWTYIEDKKNPKHKSMPLLCVEGKNRVWENSSLKTCCVQTFTLQDIINLLPKDLKGYNGAYSLTMFIYHDVCTICYSYSDEFDYYKEFESASLLDAAYQMLCWVIGNGYLKGGEK